MGIKQEAAVEEMFDQLSRHYLSSRQVPEISHEREVILRSISRALKYKRILDLGCGPGAFFDSLLDIGQEIHGIDISEKMIKVAQERLRDNPAKNRFHLKTGNAEKLDYPDAFFDAILAIGVLRYMSCWEGALSEIYRSLERGGVFACTFFYRFSPQWFSTVLFYRPLLPIISLLKGRSIKSMLLRIKSEPLPFSYRRFLKTLSALGFRDIEIRHSGFTYFPVDKLFPTLSSRLALRLGSMFHDSQIFGWLGSVCIVKALKS
jgi:ubiquinone/menaquinone biosynthesis C-methylase UbiE